MTHIATILILLSIAAVITGHTVLRKWDMWRKDRTNARWKEAIFTAVVTTALAGLGTLLYSWVGEAKSADRQMFLPALQLLKDCPIMYVVPYLATIVVDQLPGFVYRERLSALFRAAFKFFLGAFIAMTIFAACAAQYPPVGVNLDLSTSPWAFAYRAAIALPLLVFGGLLSAMYLEAFVRQGGVSRVLRARYLLFFGGCATFVVAVILHSGWPLSVVLGGPIVSQQTLGTLQTANIGMCALCWLSAFLIPCKEDDQERRLDSFERGDRAVDELAAELSRPVTDSSHTPTIAGWYTAEYLLTEAVKHLKPRVFWDYDVLAAQLLVALLGRLNKPSFQAIEFRVHVQAVKSETDSLIDALPEYVPQHSLWRQNPVLRALDAALLLSNDSQGYDLIGLPPWIQLSVLVAAHCNLLADAEAAAIFDEKDASVSPEVWNAYLFAALSLGWRLDGPASDPPPETEIPEPGTLYSHKQYK